MSSVLALAWFVAICAAALGYGLTLCRWLRVGFKSALEQIVLCLTLGLGLLSLFVLTVGLSGVLVPAVLMGLVALGVLLVAVQGTRIVRSGQSKATLYLRALAGSLPRWFQWGLLSGFVVCTVANVVGALAPPSFIDALYYHLLGPKLHAAAGAVVEIPWLWQTYQPVAVEMLYTLGIALDGPGLACLLHTALGLSAAGGAALLAQHVAGPRGGWIAAVLAYGTAMIAWESTSGFVELGVAAFGTLCVYSLLRWRVGGERGWLVLAALMGGFAASCKLPGVLIPLLGGVALVYLGLSANHGFRRTALSLIGFGALSLVVVSPWYLRAYAWTGNPVYPFMPSVFGPNAEYGDLWVNLGQYGTGRSLLDLMLAPWRLVTSGDLFERSQFLSPVPLFLAPVIAWRALRQPEIRLLVIFAGLYFLAWFSSAHVARYLVPLAPILAALCADALLALWDTRSRLFRWGAALAFFPALMMGIASTLAYNAPLAKVVVGLESETAYLTRTAWHYELYRRLTAELPPDVRILTSLGGTYYLDRPHVGVKSRAFRQGPVRLAARIQDGGYTHVLVQAGDEEAAVRECGAQVALVWHHDGVLIQSRSFGGGIPHRVALFRVRKLIGDSAGPAR